MAGDEPSRWDVEDAIQASSLPPHSRLLLYTLLSKVNKGTLTVPAEYAPSLNKLAAQTGMSKSTVAEHLNLLEDEKWIERHRPTTHEALKVRARTAYQIRIPVREPDRSGSRTSPGAGQVDEEPQVRTSPGAGLVREPDRTSPGAGHNPKCFPSPSLSEKEKGGVGGNRPRRKPETPIPDIFIVTDEMRAWAANRTPPITVDLTYETERFINHAQQNDRRCRDWLAAWRNWVLTAQKRQDERQRPTGTEGVPGHGARAHTRYIDWSQGGPSV